MVLQQKLNDLKDRPHDDKKAVATGVAAGVVIILIIAWGFIFLRKVRNSSLPSLQNTSVPGDQFDMNLIRDTERNQAIYDPEQDIRNLRNESAQNNATYEASGSGSVETNQSYDFTGGY